MPRDHVNDCPICGAGWSVEFNDFGCRGVHVEPKEPVSLAIKRVEKSTDNTKNSVIEVLEFALAELKSGKVTANKMLLLLVQQDPVSFEIESYRAGVTRIEESGMLAIFQHRHLRRWMDGA